MVFSDCPSQKLPTEQKNTKGTREEQNDGSLIFLPIIIPIIRLTSITLPSQAQADFKLWIEYDALCSNELVILNTDLYSHYNRGLQDLICANKSEHCFNNTKPVVVQFRYLVITSVKQGTQLLHIA